MTPAREAEIRAWRATWGDPGHTYLETVRPVVDDLLAEVERLRVREAEIRLESVADARMLLDEMKEPGTGNLASTRQMEIAARILLAEVERLRGLSPLAFRLLDLLPLPGQPFPTDRERDALTYAARLAQDLAATEGIAQPPAGSLAEVDRLRARVLELEAPGECQSLHKLRAEIERLRGEGACERAAVVAWLRDLADRSATIMQGNGRLCAMLADDVESGEHRREP